MVEEGLDRAGRLFGDGGVEAGVDVHGNPARRVTAVELEQLRVDARLGEEPGGGVPQVPEREPIEAGPGNGWEPDPLAEVAPTEASAAGSGEEQLIDVGWPGLQRQVGGESV